MTRTRSIGRRIVNININTDLTVLGLDCSSKTVGWGLVSLREEPKLISYGHIKPLKSDHNIIIRLQDIYNNVGSLCLQLRPARVVLEEVILYMKGKSSAKTISTLISFNRVIGLSVYSHINIVPEFFAASTIRKLIREECNIKQALKKEDIPNTITNYLEANFSIITNRNNSISSDTYDESDGIAAAWACSIYSRKQNEKSV